MNKLEEIKLLGYQTVSEITDLDKISLMTFNDNLFAVYWFMRVNHLTSLALTETDVDKIMSDGFLASSALMHSIDHLMYDDIDKMLYNTCPLDVALQRISGVPEATVEAYSLNGAQKCSWFSIQVGIYSINLPVYLWHAAASIVHSITNGERFFTRVEVFDGIPIVKLSFGRFNFMPSRQIIEYELLNTQDPVFELASDFTNSEFFNRSYSYLEMVTYVYQMIRLYDIDATWRFAFVSPIAARLVLAYEPGDTFLDALWKCLKEDIEWVEKPAEHLYISAIDIFGIKTDLTRYAINPDKFIAQIKGESR